MRVQLNKEINLEEKIKSTLGNIPYSFYYRDQTPKTEAVISYVCPECGTELHSSWRGWRLSSKENETPEEYKDIVYKCSSDLKTLIKKEATEIATLKKCPICGGELSRNKGFCMEIAGRMTCDNYGLNYYKLTNNPLEKKTSTSYNYENPGYTLVNYDFNGVNGIFKLMEKQRKEAENKEAIDKANSKVSLFDTPATALIPSEKIEIIKNSPDKLKEYLLNLIKLEVNIYSLTERLISLYFRKNDINRQSKATDFTSFYEDKERLEAAEKLLSDCLLKISRYESGDIGITRPVPPAPPIYKTPNLFNKSKVLAENEEMQRKYQGDVQAYEDGLYAFEKKKDRMIEEAKVESEVLKNKLKEVQDEIELAKQQPKEASPVSEIKVMAEKEIAEAEELLKKFFECRNEMYAYDIVFGKYRNVVALSTFYEYLMAGRCTTLEGATGAYNLYEDQVRADMIIGQLNQVIEKLDQIKNTQYMIYSELQTVNKHLDHLNTTMDTMLSSVKNMEKNIENISANTDVLAHNSALTAYYSKLNAELTSSLGYMMAFK